MHTREEVIKLLDEISDEELESVLEYLRFIKEPPEVEPTEAEIKAINVEREKSSGENLSNGGHQETREILYKILLSKSAKLLWQVGLERKFSTRKKIIY